MFDINSTIAFPYDLFVVRHKRLTDERVVARNNNARLDVCATAMDRIKSRRDDSRTIYIFSIFFFFEVIAKSTGDLIIILYWRLFQVKTAHGICDRIKQLLAPYE